MSIWNKYMHIHSRTGEHAYPHTHAVRVSRKISTQIYIPIRVNEMTGTIKQNVKTENSNSKYCLFEKIIQTHRIVKGKGILNHFLSNTSNI